MYRRIKTRVIISLLSTIFVIFTSMTAFQSLSIGGTVNQDPGIDNANTATETPKPVTVPDETTPQPIEPLLTKNQKYFEQLVSPDSTNILITGPDTYGNYDTIMIMSMDKTDKSVKIISLPRDIYIDYSDDILNRVTEAKPTLLKNKGIYKINAVPLIGNIIKYKENVGRFGKPNIDFLCDMLNEVFSIYISDYIYVKVDGVRNIIDYFGGVKIDVPILMNYYDPTQNLDIYLEPGMQLLNGKNAEGFIRFREGYNENGLLKNYGDIYRKENQVKFVQAFIAQHVTLSNLGRITTIADVITQNVMTSVKGIDAILSYGALAEEAINNNYKIESLELQCTEKNIDGSDYVLIKQTN